MMTMNDLKNTKFIYHKTVPNITMHSMEILKTVRNGIGIVLEKVTRVPTRNYCF